MFETIPFFHSYNPVTKQLTLRGASYVPPEIFQHSDAIEILDLAHGQLTDLPAEFAQLKQLRIIFLSHNPLKALPKVIAECQQLTMLGLKSCQLSEIPENVLPSSLVWLVLTDNQLTSLPQSIGQLTQLRKLSLAGNRLSSLPDSLVNCRQLELIRLGANQFATWPTWLPQLPNLAWYGDAGNPGSWKPNLLPPPEIPWTDLKLGKLLGESPSSEVYQAIWLPTQEAVAVKLYKAALTSDGYPQDDLLAHLVAGEHSNLIPVLGRLSGEPSGKLGLVRGLIPDTYWSLGLPPSLNSCTRDQYPPDTQFTPAWAETVLQQVKSALIHLHRHGIQHGDLYAHNILVNAEGHAILGDFGAASLYESGAAHWREIQDQRALKILQAELVKPT